jgi:hypothetical protein
MITQLPVLRRLHEFADSHSKKGDSRGVKLDASS